jgi:predicted Zn-dependent protease
MEFRQIITGDDQLRVMLESSLVLREAGRLEEAEIIVRGVRELVPKSDVPLVVLSTLAVRRGNFDEAQRLCEEALAKEPESVFARVHQAEVLLHQGKRGEAEKRLREIIEIAPDSPHRHTAQALLDAARMLEDK